MPKHQQAPLDKLLTLAQGYAELAMRNIGQVPPALLAELPLNVLALIVSVALPELTPEL